ncbi:MAG: glycoside hydrolase family 3 N-terminal domain-containing protein, partial [Parabacteroides sp.]|nr:glycoside hydrolase family 3 N-terminal domain-containing protein [Parabacteroides sp.]
MPALAFSAGKKNKIYQKGWIDFNKNQTKDIYEDPAAPLDDRVEDLLQQMTLEEKAGQLLAEFGWPLYTREGDKVSLTDEAQKVVVEHGTGTLWGFMRADPWTQKTLKNGLNPHYAIEACNLLQHYCIEQTRLGIPMFLAEECPHGHMAIGTTAFPTAIGQASTWNPELLQQMGEAQAMEIRKQGAHIGYGPVIDLARDPRWSRVEEGFGEDPFLAGKMGAAVVRGMQDNENYPAISTVKHFTAYGWTEGGHNGGSAHIGEYEMNELILPPFKEVTKAGLLSMMTSYNEIDGIPCTGNRHL